MGLDKDWKDYDPITGVGDPSTPIDSEGLKDLESRAQDAIDEAVAGVEVGGGGVTTSRQISSGNGLSGGGNLSADRSLSVNVDGSTLEISADNVRVKDGGITIPKLAFDPATQAELDVANAVVAALQGRLATVEALLAVTSPGTSYDLIGTLQDAFASDLTALWNDVGTITVTGGQLSVTPRKAGGYATRESELRYNLVGSGIFTKLVGTSSGATTEVGLSLSLSGMPGDVPGTAGSNALMIFVSNGNLVLRQRVNGTNDDTTVAYDATAMKYVGIFESGGSILLRTAPVSGGPWTTQRTITPSFSVTGLKAQLFAGWYGTETGLAAALFDNVNVQVDEGGSGSGGAPGGSILWDGRPAPLSLGVLAADTPIGIWDYVQRWSDYGVTTPSVAIPEVVNSPVFTGLKAFKFTVSTGGQRAEIMDTGDIRTINDDYWWSNVIYIPSNPNQSIGWYSGSHHSLNQWHANPGEIGMCYLDVRNWGNSSSGLGLQTPGGWTSLIPYSGAGFYDTPIRIEVRIKAHDSAGIVECYCQGTRLVNESGLSTLPSSGGNFVLKDGLYQSPAQGGNVFYSHGWVRGASRAAVIRT